MNTSLLDQELAPLNAQIKQVEETLAKLKCETYAVEAELETFSADRLRFDTLREACNILDRLDELEAGQLFWGELPEIRDPAGRIVRLRSHIAGFDEEIRGILEKQATLKAQGNQCLEELDYLDVQINDTYARDERRENEFAIERELSPVSHNPSEMPWSYDESDRRYRRTLIISLLLSLTLGIITRLVILPVPVRPAVVEIPKRLAMMVRKEHKKPEPVKKAKEEKKEEKKQAADKAQEKPTQERPKALPAEQVAAPKKAENTGVLKFKDAFKDLIDETPVARLGSEARLSNPATQAAGHAMASRSLLTMQGEGGGGVGNGGVSRNAGSGGIGTASLGRSAGGGNGSRLGRGGAGFTQVKSAIAGSGGKEAKSLSSGGRAGRTDEEIQILFDRYKAALYRIYNTELRKDPTLRGKMVLRITIEPSGVVSACAVDSSNMNAAEFSAQIVGRVKKFNFGAKNGVPKTTILYPIDFLPAR
ncbi:MAG: AgmX/PglI C-terminal domain-containing protein [Desulfuromonadaceae bacterium]|nr:AgmX/PglI C-terminal domain-containing protein [Desulfuromonadaceae bacterium]